MRILHVVPTYLPATRYGGPIYSVHGLARGLAELGHDVHVFTTNVDGAGTSAVPVGEPVDLDGVKVWYFPAVWPRRIYRSPEMKRALRKRVRSFDLVHLHSVFLWPTWIAARECREQSVPYVVSPRGMMVKELIRLKSRLIKSLWIRFIERRNLENAKAIHVTADIEADELEKFRFELPDILEIPNGVDTPSGSVALASSEDVRQACRMQRPMILYLGRVNWKKNLIELAQAMAHVPTGHLIVAGYDEDDYGHRVAAAAASADVQDRVTVFARPVLGTDKEALLSRCDVFVLPSLSENFGNAALEAAVRGKPLVVSEGSGVATMIREQHCGLICRPQSESIAEAINRLLSEPNMARTMGQRARIAASRQYSWPAIARSMSSAYQALIEQRVGNNSYNQTGLESEADGVLRPLGGSRRASSTVRDNAISTSSRWRE